MWGLLGSSRQLNSRGSRLWVQRPLRSSRAGSGVHSHSVCLCGWHRLLIGSSPSAEAVSLTDARSDLLIRTSASFVLHQVGREVSVRPQLLRGWEEGVESRDRAPDVPAGSVSSHPAGVSLLQRGRHSLRPGLSPARHAGRRSRMGICRVVSDKSTSGPMP